MLNKTAIMETPMNAVFRGLVALTLVAAWERHATACERAVEDGRNSKIVSPDQGRRGVAVNSRVWVGIGHTMFATTDAGFSNSIAEARTITVVGPNGEAVTGSQSLLRSDETLAFSVFTPSTALLPETTYEIRVDGELLDGFTTGVDGDTSAPAIPTVESSRVEGYVYGAYSCGQPAGVWLDVSEIDFLVAASTEAEPSVDTTALAGKVTTLSDERHIWVPAPANDGSFSVRLAQWDRMGNFSGWSEPQAFTLPRSQSTCACSQVEGADSLVCGTALALLGLGGIARRHGRRARG
ncbi:MAG: hypothetical protein AB2A00_17180 [Myxococcota bacterium]